MYNCDTVFGLFIGIKVIVLGHFVTKKEKNVHKLLQPLADVPITLGATSKRRNFLTKKLRNTYCIILGF
jgi:hypothetical protein